jgi:hypothetical protein
MAQTKSGLGFTTTVLCLRLSWASVAFESIGSEHLLHALLAQQIILIRSFD